MKILVLAPYNAAIIKRFVTTLKGNDVEVVIASHDAGSEEGVYDLGPLRSLFDYFRTFKLNKIITEFRPDVIHAHYATHYGVMAALQGRVPFILALWGSDILVASTKGSLIKRTFYRYLIKFVVKKASMCHSSGAHVCSEASSLSGEKDSKFHSFFWGIVPSHLKSVNHYDDVSKLDEEFGLRDKKVVLCARGVGDIYRPDYIASLIARNHRSLAAQGIRIVVLRASASDTEVRRFNNLTCDEEAHFTFVDRMLNDKELAYVYSKCIVHVSVPYSDSLGGGVVEPVFTGSFPILSDLPGNRWFVDNFWGEIVDASSCTVDLLSIVGSIDDVRKERVVAKVCNEMSERQVVSRLMGLFKRVAE